jgi:hypothetical protein
MVFRRPRVNVKPNVQATRPVNTIARSQETSTESISTQSQEEQSTQQIDLPIAIQIIKGINRSMECSCTNTNKSKLNTHIQKKLLQ